MSASEPLLAPVCCPGVVQVTIERQGWEGRAYMQSEIVGLGVECAQDKCYWYATDIPDATHTLTRNAIVDYQAQHDMATQREASPSTPSNT